MGYVGGIRAASPGYKTILIDPVIGNGLTWAKTSYYSIHGAIATYWKTDGTRFLLDVAIPANTRAMVCIPGQNAADVTESGMPLDKAQDVTFLKQENGKVYVEIGSGKYKFISESQKPPAAT